MAVLPTPGSPIKHRVVLGAALQHLNGAADFVVAADHRIEFAVPCALGQIQGVFLQRLALALRFRIGHRVAPAYGIDGLLQRWFARAMLFEQTAEIAPVIERGGEEQFAGNILVAALLRFLVGQVEQVVQVARNGNLAAMTFHFGQPAQGLVDGCLECGHLYPGLGQDGPAAPVLLGQQGRHQVQRFNELLVAAHREGLGIGQGLLELAGKFVETHDVPQ